MPPRLARFFLTGFCLLTLTTAFGLDYWIIDWTNPPTGLAVVIVSVTMMILGATLARVIEVNYNQYRNR
jgi:hypothetical protein